MMRSQTNNQKSFSKDEDFMQSIYNKVSALRQNLESYQNNSPIVKKTNDKIRHSHTQSQNHISQINQFYCQPKLSFVTLNDQSKIHRQAHFLKLKFSNRCPQNFSKTTLEFSSTHRHHPKQPSTLQITSKQRSLSSFNFTSNKEFNKTIKYSNSSLTKQTITKRHFFSKQLPSQSGTEIKQNKIPQKGRTENKMDRIAGFLKKEDNRYRKNTKLNQDIRKSNKSKDVSENEEVTQFNKNIEDSMIVLDSDNNFDNFYPIESLKEERKQLEQRQTFKPIGSANGLRGSGSKNQYTINSQHESKLGARELDQLNQQTQRGVKAGSLSPERQSALRKNYLEKGNRFREILYKKLLKQDSGKPQQMIYVKKYDQWVPSKLLQNNRKQLESYMKMLLGQKKINKNNNKLSLENIDLVYY